jgi:hypothetical protein
MVESTVEPPFKPEWILQKGFFTYMWDRAKRYWGGTRASYVYRRVNFTSQLIRSLLQMRKRGAAPARLATSTLESVKFLLTNRKPSQRYIPMLLDLRQIYGEYNLAIAE